MRAEIVTNAPTETASMAEVVGRLRAAGLRPTRQRRALGALLFTGEDHHVTAEMLHEQAVRASVPVSLATVYNTLHQFTAAGLLRHVVVAQGRAYFDTNTADHHHFYFEESGRLVDIDADQVDFARLPQAPTGADVSRIDVVIRVRERPEG